MNFVITGLPRSRSAWFAAYFTNGVETCHFEAIGDNIPLGPEEGTADCGYMLVPEWVTALGKHKLVVVHRPASEVLDWWITYKQDPNILYEMEKGLDKLPGFHVDFHRINEYLPEIHDYLNIPYDKERAELYCRLNIQAEKYKC